MIKAAQADLFELLDDLVRLVECMEFIDYVEILSQQKRGQGTRARWPKKAPPTEIPISWMEKITLYNPPHQIGFATAEGERQIRGTLSLKAISENETEITFHEEFLYPNPDLAGHNAGMENQLASMKRCLE
ncbi:MAG: SRPBCC family protein [Candidatus Ranarchaeia archaeon]